MSKSDLSKKPSDVYGLSVDPEYIKNIVRECIGEHLNVYHSDLLPAFNISKTQHDAHIKEAFNILRSIVREEIKNILNEEK